ncbi:MAG: hypothetical protein Q9162_003172 [Coniocarpon cinnabarinum]
MAQVQGRTTRSRSKDVDPNRTSAMKKAQQPRRGRSASVEQNGQELVQQAAQQFDPAALPTVAEDDEALFTSLHNAAQQGDVDSQPVPFDHTSAETVRQFKNLKSQKMPQNRQQVPAASAPTAVMTNDQAQHLAQVVVLDPRLNPNPSIMDRQPDASRVTFADSQPSQLEALAEEQNIHEAPTQDDGFQEPEIDAAPVKTKKKPSRKTRAVDPPSEEYQPSEPLGTPPPTNYSEVQQQAKLFTAGLRRENRVPQKRKAWSSEECDALIDGIGHYGTAYASLKGDDAKHRDFLHDRSAEDLRHKARNMKFDYLKAGVTLPEGFEQVLLDKKFQEKLAAMGREYSQEQRRQSKRPKVVIAASPENGEPNDMSQQ